MCQIWGRKDNMTLRTHLCHRNSDMVSVFGAYLDYVKICGLLNMRAHHSGTASLGIGGVLQEGGKMGRAEYCQQAGV